MKINVEDMLINIYEETYDDIYRYVLSKCRDLEDISDLIQNTYLKFYKELKKGKEIKEPKKYLIRIARNEVFKNYKILSFTKGNVPIFSHINEDEFRVLHQELSVEKDYESKMICNDIWNYLKKKDSLTLKIFILYFKNDLKIKDIAMRLEIKESTIKSRLYRTIKQVSTKFNV